MSHKKKIHLNHNKNRYSLELKSALELTVQQISVGASFEWNAYCTQYTQFNDYNIIRAQPESRSWNFFLYAH